LRCKGDHAIATETHTHQDILDHPLTIAERYITTGIVRRHHYLAVFAKRFTGDPFGKNFHYLSTR